MPRTTQLIAPEKIEIKEIEFLSSGPGEAIVEVQHAGVCGTDLVLFKGDYPVLLPHICGHKFTERVKSVGDGIDKKWVGKTVTKGRGFFNI
jgi:D-arabinose 1-dehydrogenase-like Zn-dependent alcohol dehydrogenase